MASSIIFQSLPNKSGTVVDIYPFASDTAIATGLASTEETNAKGFYRATYTGSDEGMHRIVVRDSATNILANWYIDLTNSDKIDIAQDTDPQMEILKTQTQGLHDSTHLAFRHVLTGGAITGGDYTDTRVVGVSQFTLNLLPEVELPTSAGFGRYINSVEIRASVSNDSRPCDILLFNYNNQTFENIGSINTTSLTTQNIGINIKYSDPATGDIRIKFDGSVEMDIGDVLTLDFYEAKSHSTFFELAKRIGEYDTSISESVKTDIGNLNDFDPATQPVDLNPDQSSVTIGIVNSVTNDVNLNLGQVIPGIVTVDTIGWAFARAHQLTFDPTFSKVISFVEHIDDNVITANSIAANAIGSSELATDAITSSQIAANAIGSSELANNAITSSQIADDAITANKIASNAITAAKIASNAIGSSELATNAIGSDQLASSAISEIQGACDDALVDNHLDHLLKVVTTTFPGNAGSILGEMIERITTWRFVAEALSQAAAGSGSVIADAVWDELRSGHTTPGSFGEGVIINTNNDKTGYDLNDNQQTVTIGGVFNGVDLLADQSGVTIGTVDNVTNAVDLNTDQSGVTIGTVSNDVNLNMSQAIPGLTIIDTVGWALARANQLTFDPTFSKVLSFIEHIDDNVITFDVIAPNAIASDQLDATAIQEFANAMRLTPIGTVNADSVDDKLDTIISDIQNQNPTQQTRTSDVLTTGTQTGTSANTILQDGTEWVLTSVAAGVDAELIFNIGTNEEIPSSFQMFGNFDSGQGRVLQIQVFNFAQNDWENRGTPITHSSNSTTRTYGLRNDHVKRDQAGTPGVNGDVRVRFLYDLTVSGKVNANDDIHLDYAGIFWIREGITLGSIVDIIEDSNPNRNYPGSTIVIDGNNGVPGTIVGVNGTPGNPVNNITDARILADALGFIRYMIEGDTTLTLDQSYDNWEFVSFTLSGTIVGNSQSTDGAVFARLRLQGTFLASANGMSAFNCGLEGITTQGFFSECVFPQAASVIVTGDCTFRDCDSNLPGVINPGIDCNNITNLNLSITKYAGGIDFTNIAATAQLTVSGRGEVNFVSAASGASATVSGHMTISDALPTGFNLTDLARIDQPQITEAVEDATINTVNNITNPVDIDMSQPLPGLPAANTTGLSLSKSHQLVFDGGNVNSKVQDFSDTEWKRLWEQVSLAESYASTGSIHSASQIMYLVMSILQNPQYVNFEFRARRLDGTTEAAAFQMDDDTNPTQHNRIR
jgi:hypothetical protein